MLFTVFTLLVTAASASKPFVGSFEIVGTICYPPDSKGEDKGMSPPVSQITAMCFKFLHII
jgi:hypothetical protein